MKRIVIGLLAHVDAGKTTLSEALLCHAGVLKKPGRVDHKDAFLDTFALERERGITIFSKQALLPMPDAALTLLDTPGHVDFSAEMERTLQVLDYAVLVISGTDGVQSHTRTLWQLLHRRHIPTFLFINKMDIAGTDRTLLMDELRRELHENCIYFPNGPSSPAFLEDIAVCDEDLLERCLNGQPVEEKDIARLIATRKVFPCYFGSALRMEGTQALLTGLERYTRAPETGDDFGAQVFKIMRDQSGSRLTFLKVTGGTLYVRDLLSGSEDGGWQEKVNQIRLYSGAKYQTVDRAETGTVCAVTGLSHTRPGTGLGTQAKAAPPMLEPVLSYSLGLPEGCDAHIMLQNLRQLEEEDPLLRVTWDDALGEIQLQLMGEVQIEVLTRLIRERFGVDVTFDTGRILYRETIAAPVLGIGHFEPLRHYAEVQLLLEPGEPGSGLRFSTVCPLDTLDLNWQRLIMTHLAEKTHRGVLIGAPVTDLQITLLTGRAHLKHTEGGDFREATYRAVRQGLMQAQNVLLEPYYAFRLELPSNCLGRAMADIQRMDGTFRVPEEENGHTVLYGTAPVCTMRSYWTEVAAYTKGQGRLSCSLEGYHACHNAGEVIATSGYDPENDPANPPDSVFCSHGAGHLVKWYDVKRYAHMDAGFSFEEEREDAEKPSAKAKASKAYDDEDELRAIFERTYGPIKNRGFEAFRQSRKKSAVLEQLYVTRVREDDYLLVDGYNILFAWDELRAIADKDINAARETLLNQLSNYQSVRKCNIIVVFDAYKVKGGVGSVERLYGLDVVYTRESQTADAYIEQTSYDLAKKHHVRVATSDGLEQMIILGHGAERISATELHWEVEEAAHHVADLIRAINDR